MRRHFQHRHPQHKVWIRNESAYTLPQCHLCALQYGQGTSQAAHEQTQECNRGRNRMARRRALRAASEAYHKNFSVDNVELSNVTSFCYLGRPVTYNDSNWAALYKNLRKARTQWTKLARILVRDGATPRISGLFYKAVVQAVLLYGCETWVISPTMLKMLEGFHHRAARRISGKRPRLVHGEWIYPPIAEALEIAGLYPIYHYVAVRHNTIAQHIATRPIYQQCTTADIPTGTSRCLRWWTQQLHVDWLAGNHPQQE